MRRKKEEDPMTHIIDTEWEEKYLQSLTPKEKFWYRVSKVIMFIICVGSPIFIFVSFGIAIYTNKPFLWYLFH